MLRVLCAMCWLVSASVRERRPCQSAACLQSMQQCSLCQSSMWYAVRRRRAAELHLWLCCVGLLVGDRRRSSALIIADEVGGGDNYAHLRCHLGSGDHERQAARGCATLCEAQSFGGLSAGPFGALRVVSKRQTKVLKGARGQEKYRTVPPSRFEHPPAQPRSRGDCMPTHSCAIAAAAAPPVVDGVVARKPLATRAR